MYIQHLQAHIIFENLQTLVVAYWWILKVGFVDFLCSIPIFRILQKNYYFCLGLFFM